MTVLLVQFQLVSNHPKLAQNVSDSTLLVSVCMLRIDICYSNKFNEL